MDMFEATFLGEQRFARCHSIDIRMYTFFLLSLARFPTPSWFVTCHTLLPFSLPSRKSAYFRQLGVSSPTPTPMTTDFQFVLSSVFGLSNYYHVHPPTYDILHILWYLLLRQISDRPYRNTYNWQLSSSQRSIFLTRFKASNDISFRMLVPRNEESQSHWSRIYVFVVCRWFVAFREKHGRKFHITAYILITVFVLPIATG